MHFSSNNPLQDITSKKAFRKEFNKLFVNGKVLPRHTRTFLKVRRFGMKNVLKDLLS